MFQFPHGYKPGIPTLNAEQEAAWVKACQEKRLLMFFYERDQVSWPRHFSVNRETVIANGRALGMDDHTIHGHIGGAV